MAKGKFEQWLTAEGLVLIEGWARDGLTDEQIAHNMGINRRTLTEWKRKYPPISLTLKRGKEVVDRQVENALLKRALGYQFEEETYISMPLSQEEYDLKVSVELDVWKKEHPNATQDERDLFILSIPRTREVLEKKVIKQVSPDTTAQIFWLKNRKPAEWRDKREIEHGGEINNNIDLSGLSVEELRKLARSDD